MSITPRERDGGMRSIDIDRYRSNFIDFLEIYRYLSIFIERGHCNEFYRFYRNLSMFIDIYRYLSKFIEIYRNLQEVIAMVKVNQN